MDFLPVYEALITDDGQGIYNVSLVDAPAVLSNFMAFKNTEPMKYSVQNEEQRIVFGVLMRADFNIYRVDPEHGEFYIRYSKETIKKMAEKLMIDNKQNSVNIMHVDGSNVEGVNLIELFIKNTERGINPAGFEDIEDGSLFAAYKVENEAVWSMVKDGTFKGFSIEGFFDINKIEFDNKMSIKSKIINAVMKFGEVNTDKGMIYWTGEEDLKAGDEVYVGEEKDRAEDGEYVTEDGKVIKVVEGVVSEITDPKAEVDSTEEEFTAEKEETKVEAAEETETETVTETVTETETENDYSKEIEALKSEVEFLKGEVEAIRGELERVIAELQKPAAEPIEEQFEKIQKREAKRGNAARILSHLND